MLDFASQKLADGLGIKQEVTPQMAMQLRQTQASPKQFIGGFATVNLLHINNHGQFHRDIKMGQIHQSEQFKIHKIQSKPVIASTPMMQQSQQLRTQLAMPSTQPNSRIQNQIPYQQPNYAGQYIQPQQTQPKQINLIQQRQQQAKQIRQQKRNQKINQMQKELQILQRQNQSER